MCVKIIFNIGGMKVKKRSYALFVIITLFFLTSCGTAEDLTDYIDVSFSGMDSQGHAEYEVKEDKLHKEIFDYDEEEDFADDETEEEMDNLDDAYKIKLDPKKDLSNGDKVKVTASVNDEKTDKIKDGEKEVTVKNLEEPETLTTDDVENNLVINFNGASGRGKAKIDNKLDDSLSSLDFEIDDDGELENGDEVKAVLKGDENEQQLNQAGYVLEEDFNPTFEVEGLDKVAKEASDIDNLKDIKRMIKEEVEDEYEDTSPDESYGTVYDIDKEAMLYRPFEEDEDDDNRDEEPPDMMGEDPVNKNGSLIGIYSITKYSGGDDKEKEKEFTAVIGFSNIILDDDDEGNVSDMEELSTEKDDKYSTESVVQLYEGDGYEKLDD